jgi:hypothetical protein
VEFELTNSIFWRGQKFGFSLRAQQCWIAQNILDVYSIILHILYYNKLDSVIPWCRYIINYCLLLYITIMIEFISCDWCDSCFSGPPSGANNPCYTDFKFSPTYSISGLHYTIFAIITLAIENTVIKTADDFHFLIENVENHS